MSHYFLAGNLWLLVAAVVCWGREYSRGGSEGAPVQWKLFGIGREFYTYQYNWIIVALLAMAAMCFVRHIVHQRRDRGKNA